MEFLTILTIINTGILVVVLFLSILTNNAIRIVFFDILHKIEVQIKHKKETQG